MWEVKSTERLWERIASFCCFNSVLRVLTSGTSITFPKGKEGFAQVFFFNFVILCSTFRQLKHNFGLTIITGARRKAVTMKYSPSEGYLVCSRQSLLNSILMARALQITTGAKQLELYWSNQIRTLQLCPFFFIVIVLYIFPFLFDFFISMSYYCCELHN